MIKRILVAAVVLAVVTATDVQLMNSSASSSNSVSKCSCTEADCENWNSSEGRCSCSDETKLKATLGYSDISFTARDFESTVTLDGDGTYTLEYVSRDSDGNALDEPLKVDEPAVLWIDIPDVFSSDRSETELYPDFNVKIKKITVDDKDIKFDSSKIKYYKKDRPSTAYHVEIIDLWLQDEGTEPFDTSEFVGDSFSITFEVTGTERICTCSKKDDSYDSQDDSSYSWDDSFDDYDESGSDSSGPEEIYSRFETTVRDDGTLEITTYTGNAQDVYIPEEIDGVKVTSIALENIYGSDRDNGINCLHIPATINSIDLSSYFVYAGFIMEFDVDEDNEYYSSEGGALYNKEKTELLRFPTGREEAKIADSTVKIDFCAFAFCTRLIDVTLPDSVKEIEDSIFFCCKNLENVTMPKAVDKLGSGIFGLCDNLQTVMMPETANTAGSSTMFNGCYKLESVNFPIGTLKLDSQAVDNCDTIKELILPQGLTSLNEGCITNCDELEKIILPDSIDHIGTTSITDCPKLREIVIPAKGEVDFGYKNESIGYMNIDGTTTKLDDFTLYGYKNTSVERYATENDINFVSLDADSPAGDTNADGRVTMKDYSELQKYLSGWDVEIDLAAADLNGDGKVNMRDYTLLQKLLNGWEI